MFWLFGKEYKYPCLNWYENFMSGHFDIKIPFLMCITIYGENAMHWAVNIHIFKTYVCFRLPFRCFGVWYPLYFYISKDGTPTNAKFKIGKT